MHPLLIKAGEIAISLNHNDSKRNFLLGSIGIRNDGVRVSAKNGSVITSSYNEYRVISDAHAEMRCLKKMGKGGVLYTARILKKDGSYAMARACGRCLLRMKMAGVEKAYYTIDNFHYGVLLVQLGTDRIYDA